MHNIDDCLFKTSLTISVEGDADIKAFEAQMEHSYSLFLDKLRFRLQLLDNAPGFWSFRRHEDVSALDPESLEAIVWFLNYLRVTVLRYKKIVLGPSDNMKLLSLTQFDQLGLLNKFYVDHFSDFELRAAFAEAINQGFISISYKGILIRNFSICFCFELEGPNNIHQYYWRSRWVLALVNFLINSQRTSKRVSQKAAVVIRHFRKRLFKKPSQRV